MKISATSKDLTAGLLFLAAGAFILYSAVQFRIGTPRVMGPGFFPAMLGGLLIVLALITILRSFGRRDEGGTAVRMRPVLFILGAAASFGLLIKPAGLLIAVFGTVVIASFASNDLRLRDAVIVGVILAGLSALVFVELLGQRLPLLGTVFG